MSADIRLEVAQEQVAAMADAKLKELADRDAVWDLAWRVRVPAFKLERIVLRERFRRGLIAMGDLTPEQRRGLVDPQNLDLHAIAAGPIMDVGEIYLPAGKLSMEETRRREQACILSAKAIEARSAETGNTDSARRAKARSATPICPKSVTKDPLS